MACGAICRMAPCSACVGQVRASMQGGRHGSWSGACGSAMTRGMRHAAVQKAPPGRLDGVVSDGQRRGGAQAAERTRLRSLHVHVLCRVRLFLAVRALASDVPPASRQATPIVRREG